MHPYCIEHGDWKVASVKKGAKEKKLRAANQ